MNHYRNFEVDPNGWDYSAASEFLSFLHDRGQHFVPIVDSAIYIPNPDNASDAYPTFERGLDADAFILNPDGSLYIGTVWPGYTGMYAALPCPWRVTEFSNTIRIISIS